MDITEDKPLNQYADFWQARYDECHTPWDLGEVSPHFVKLFKEGKINPGSIFVPGCGRGHDAAFFAEQGFTVTAVDYTDGAIDEAKKLYGHLDRLKLRQADIFHLSENDGDQFDYVLEHTCFCAINPRDRERYVKMVDNVLKQGGQLIGVFWQTDDSEGPPFDSNPEDIMDLFSPYFQVRLHEIVEQNAGERWGQEHLFCLVKK